MIAVHCIIQWFFFSSFDFLRSYISETTDRSGKEMAVFKTCCCCISLRMGCIILALMDFFGQMMGVETGTPRAPIMLGTMVTIITASLLLYGSYKRNRLCLWPWIVVSIIKNIAFTVGLLLCFFAPSVIIEIVKTVEAQGGPRLTDWSKDEMEMVMAIALSFMILLPLQIYVTLVAYSLVCELREEEARQNNNINVPPKAYNFEAV